MGLKYVPRCESEWKCFPLLWEPKNWLLRQMFLCCYGQNLLTAFFLQLIDRLFLEVELLSLPVWIDLRCLQLL